MHAISATAKEAPKPISSIRLMKWLYWVKRKLNACSSNTAAIGMATLITSLRNTPTDLLLIGPNQTGMIDAKLDTLVAVYWSMFHESY